MFKSGAGFYLEHALDINLTEQWSNTYFIYRSVLFLRRKSSISKELRYNPSIKIFFLVPLSHGAIF